MQRRNIALLAALVAAPALVGARGEQKAGGTATGSQQQQMQQGHGGKEQAVKQFRAEDKLFTEPNYEIEGRISSASGEKIKIRREDLPEAELSLASNTRVELDGNRTSAEQLREGQRVHATFNIQGDTAVALEVNAERREQPQGMQRGEPTSREMPPETGRPSRGVGPGEGALGPSEGRPQETR